MQALSNANERHLERGLLEHLRAFLLEMGAGFAFVGCQYHLEVSGKDYYHYLADKMPTVQLIEAQFAERDSDASE